MIKFLRNILYEPSILNQNVNGQELFHLHKKAISKKKLLISAFATAYQTMLKLSDKYFKIKGMEVELGSGVGFIKKFRNRIKTSDIRPGNDSELRIDAQKMKLKTNSIKCIYAINVFHHLPDPKKFLDELCRVLKKRGGVVLIEPHNGFFSSLVHKYLSKDEQYMPNIKSWKNKKISGPLFGANQALSYIVFERDLSKFNKIYGNRLQIVHKTYVLNFLRYFLSGGLNFRELLPFFFNPFLTFIEILCRPFAKFCSLHQVIVLKRI